MTLVSRNWIAAAAAAVLALVPVSVLAGTAANTTITNTVRVTYTDSGGAPQPDATASVSITVNHVPSAPNVALDSITPDPAAENNNVALVYTVTGTSNGDDTYNVSAAIGNVTDLDGTTAPSATTISLGATSVATELVGGATVSTIEVPYDGSDNDDVNTLSGGETIVIDPSGEAIVAEIASVDTSNGPTGNTAEITLVTGITPSGNIAAGLLIVEQAEISLQSSHTTITAGNTSGSYEVTATFTSDTDNGQTVTTPAATVNVEKLLTVTKYVQNTSGTQTGSGSTASAGGITYYTGGITGDPGDTLSYLIVVDNVGSALADNLVVEDTVPQFTDFQSGSLAVENNGGGFTSLTDGAGDDRGEINGSDITVWAGTGASAGTGGSLAGGEVSRVTFEVTIQ